WLRSARLSSWLATLTRSQLTAKGYASERSGIAARLHSVEPRQRDLAVARATLPRSERGAGGGALSTPPLFKAASAGTWVMSSWHWARGARPRCGRRACLQLGKNNTRGAGIPPAATAWRNTHRPQRSPARRPPLGRAIPAPLALASGFEALRVCAR